MHGPCSDKTDISSCCPEFGTPTPVVDDVLNTISVLRVRKRRRWRKARDWALTQWEQAGIALVLEVGPGAFHDYYDPENPSDTYLTPLVVPGKVRVVRDKTPPGGRDDVAICFGTGSACSVDLEKPVTDPIYEWPRVVCHEIGHCLGLGHGGNGIMLGGLAPNAHDLDSVRAYYTP